MSRDTFRYPRLLQATSNLACNIFSGNLSFSGKPVLKIMELWNRIMESLKLEKSFQVLDIPFLNTTKSQAPLTISCFIYYLDLG